MTHSSSGGLLGGTTGGLPLVGGILKNRLIVDSHKPGFAPAPSTPGSRRSKKFSKGSSDITKP
jgi:hypothetical protein